MYTKLNAIINTSTTDYRLPCEILVPLRILTSVTARGRLKDHVTYTQTGVRIHLSKAVVLS